MTPRPDYGESTYRGSGKLQGKSAIITGGDSGIGRAVALALVGAGYRVVLAGRRLDMLHQVAQEGGERCVPIVADVSTQTGGEAFVAAAIEELGSVDILVTNAGGPPPGNFASTPPERYATALELNLLSVVGMCQAAVPAMRARGWGRVVAITSYTVRQPHPNLILSNTARAGVTGFLKSLAREIAADGVTVNSVQPGIHATDRLKALGPLDAMAAAIPAGFIGDPDDFGAVVAFLCSNQARFVTGSHLAIDGGEVAGLL